MIGIEKWHEYHKETEQQQTNLPKSTQSLTGNNEKEVDGSDTNIVSKTTENSKTMVAQDQKECPANVQQDDTQQSREALEDRGTMVALDQTECTTGLNQDDDHPNREALEGYVKPQGVAYKSNASHTNCGEETENSQVTETIWKKERNYMTITTGQTNNRPTCRKVHTI